MASSVQWCNLHPDILTIISKILDADVEILRLRSVCSNWRSSILRRLRPSPFPLQVPPLSSHYGASILSGHYSIDYTTFYRLSQPEHGPYAGDPSQGLLFRVLELNPNLFLVSDPLLSTKPKYTPGTIPNHLNLLNHRITEVSKSYCLTLFDGKACASFMNSVVKKVVVLRNYVVGCDFAVIVLRSDQVLCYWRFGDKAWTPIDTKVYDVTDVVLCNGKCYGIGRKGVLVWFDSNLKLTVAPLPRLPVDYAKSENYLVEYKSDLYAVSRITDLTISSDDEGSNEKVSRIYEYSSSDEDEDDDSKMDRISETSFKLKVFKKCNNQWERIRCLRDVMLVSSDDVSFGLSAEDFKGKRGNCVYVAHVDYSAVFGRGDGNGLHYGVFHLDEGRTQALKLVRDWPPPQWVQEIAKDS